GGMTKRQSPFEYFPRKEHTSRVLRVSAFRELVLTNLSDCWQKPNRLMISRLLNNIALGPNPSSLPPPIPDRLRRPPLPYLLNTPADVAEMLKAIGVSSITDLFAPIPPDVRFGRELDIPKALSEIELTQHVGALAKTNHAA